jgi:hypothetical protein
VTQKSLVPQVAYFTLASSIAPIVLDSALLLLGHRFGHFRHHLDKVIHLALDKFLFHAPLGLFVDRMPNEQFVGQRIEPIVLAVHERLDFPATRSDFRQCVFGMFFTISKTEKRIDGHKERRQW